MDWLNLIWLGAEPPLTVLYNLSKLMEMFTSQAKQQEGVFCPFFWIDQRALSLLNAKKTVGTSICEVTDFSKVSDPSLLKKIDEIEIYLEKFPGLKKNIQFLAVAKELQKKVTEKFYIPMLVWDDIEEILQIGLLHFFKSNQINNIFSIINFARDPGNITPAAVASDILRLLQLLILPGSMYIDITDVKLKRLPTQDDMPPGAKVVCRISKDLAVEQYQLVSTYIRENDILYATDQNYLRRVLEYIADNSLSKSNLLQVNKSTRSIEEDIMTVQNVYDFAIQDFMLLVGREAIQYSKKTIDQLICLLIFNLSFRQQFLNLIEAFKDSSSQRQNLENINRFYSSNGVPIMALKSTLQNLVAQLSFEAFTTEAPDQNSFYALLPTRSGRLEQEVFTKEALEGKGFSSWKMPGENLLRLVQFCEIAIQEEGTSLAVHAMWELNKIYSKYKECHDNSNKKLKIEIERKVAELQEKMKRSISLSLPKTDETKVKTGSPVTFTDQKTSNNSEKNSREEEIKENGNLSKSMYHHTI